MMLRLRVVSMLCLGAMLSVGCGSRTDMEDIVCEPVGDSAPLRDLGDLAGTYRLTLIATQGPQSGDTTTGELEVVEQEDQWREFQRPDGRIDPTTTVPFMGTVDVDPEAVGAVTAGDLSSTVPDRPGVALYQSARSDGSVGAVMRLGAESNRRDVERFEGAFLALRLEEVDAEGFAGSWASGAPDVQARGYFCAVREE